MPGAQEWSGIAQGLNQASKDYSERDLRKAQLAEAKAKQQKAQGELQEFTANQPNRDRTAELQLQQLEAQTTQINAQALTNMTYSAFDRFKADGSTRHLNTWLADAKKNPQGSRIYGEVARYDELTDDDETGRLLSNAGYGTRDILKNPDILKSFVQVTGTNGERTILPVEAMYAATGYDKYLSNQELEKLEKQARIQQALRSGTSMAKITLQERVVEDLVRAGKAADLGEAYKMLKEMEANNSGRGILTTTEERAVERIMEEHNLPYVDALAMYYSTKRQDSGSTNETRFVEEYRRNNPEASYEEAVAEYKNLGDTSTQKQIKDVKVIRDSLDEMDWLNTSIKDMSKVDRAKVYRDYISPLEDLRNFKFDAEEKRTVRNLRNLTALGGTAGSELTESETGLLDSTLGNFKKYVDNNVGGVKGKAAYETFRNIFRNALYGSALTDNEIKAFNKAAGNLGQQLNPVLDQLNVQMSTIKNNLVAIRDLNDPDIAHYYLGQSVEEIDETIEAIENRLGDPRLRVIKKGEGGSSVTVRRKNVEPIEPTVTPPATDFDFDAAMDEAGL